MRVELLHPLLAHFPIGCLSLAAALQIIFQLVRVVTKREFLTLKTTSDIVLGFGVVGAWAAVLAGDEAEDVVNRLICDPTVTAEHEYYAKLASILFTVSLAFVLARIFLRKRELSLLVRSVFEVGVVALQLTGLAALLYTGHLGASLVYQQGAGVYHPSPECAEFE